ncbi:MAG: hypothetical protein C0631_14105 [Sedimenticola sp.]|nr:MAG: hypothetical protein C0631_14105 [Sedimenticola sp.]
MHIRTTMDPMTLHDVANPEQHPCLYQGDGDNGLEIYFESEENLMGYLDLKSEPSKVIQGDDSEDYVAEG